MTGKILGMRAGAGALVALFLIGGCDLVLSLDRSSTAMKVDVAHVHSCAIVDGEAWCWGDNFHGELGDGTNDDHLLPVRATITDPVVSIATGGESTGGAFSCALTTDHRVLCWGTNGVGQLGDGTTGGSRGMPDTVANLEDVMEIDLGASHACVRLGDGAIECWGDNQFGQVDTTQPSDPIPQPHEVPVIAGAVALSVGTTHSCAIDGDRAVWCWGDNTTGAIADVGATMLGPTEVVEMAGADRVFAGEGVTCAIVNGDGVCRGLAKNNESSIATVPDPRVYAGTQSNAIVVDVDGVISGVGINQFGELGLGDMTQRNEPIEIQNLPPFAELAMRAHTCARATDDSIWCWGRNSNGQVGNGQSMNSVSLPTQLTFE